MISDKVRPHHLERKAILYVRQSSAHQVLHNRESSALQYAMRGRLTALGWSDVEVIDDDLGRSRLKMIAVSFSFQSGSTRNDLPLNICGLNATARYGATAAVRGP
jgi:hypothetical protein